MAVQEHGGANSQGAETLKHKVSPGNDIKKKKGAYSGLAMAWVDV